MDEYYTDNYGQYAEHNWQSYDNQEFYNDSEQQDEQGLYDQYSGYYEGDQYAEHLEGDQYAGEINDQYNDSQSAGQYESYEGDNMGTETEGYGGVSSSFSEQSKFCLSDMLTYHLIHQIIRS